MRSKKGSLIRQNISAHQLFQKTCRELVLKRRRKSDSAASTFQINERDQIPVLLHSNHFTGMINELQRGPRYYSQQLIENYLSHRFMLLGSNLVQVRHSIQCDGLAGISFPATEPVTFDSSGRWLEGRINQSNLQEAQRIWRCINMVHRKDNDRPGFSSYVPIDWQLDFKSGFRWSESTWYKDIKLRQQRGSDIKVPWELSRFQHLPQLALHYGYLLKSISPVKITDGEADTRPLNIEPEDLVREFRNQVLDFIATNPPRFGVNWSCTMEVAIRIVNCLFAYDLFGSFGATFDDAFYNIFNRSVYEHGRHIIENLEWRDEFRGNHYLADIAGLLFVAVYLSRTHETDAWLALAIQEFTAEVTQQFLPDGSNFEGSTSYHRLSAEIVVYCTALILGLSEEKLEALNSYENSLISGKPCLRPAPLPRHLDRFENKESASQSAASLFSPDYLERLDKMAEFTIGITKPSGHVVQIGDNDSGRFFKLLPIYSASISNTAHLTPKDEYGDSINLSASQAPREDHLDHRHLVAAINGLFNRADFTEFSASHTLESTIVRQLANGRTLPKKHLTPHNQNDETLLAESLELRTEEGLNLNLQTSSMVYNFTGADLRQDLLIRSYPYFGLFIYESTRLFLAIRCGPVGQNGQGGHAHNDQLAIELVVDGIELIVDPGTFIYTPLPEWRNEYRSVKAHFAPRIGDHEPGDLSLGLFRLPDTAQPRCLKFSETEFLGYHLGYGRPIYRRITIEEQRIVIDDMFADRPPNNLLNGENLFSSSVPFSPGYGEISKYPKITTTTGLFSHGKDKFDRTEPT